MSRFMLLTTGILSSLLVLGCSGKGGDTGPSAGSGSTDGGTDGGTTDGGTTDGGTTDGGTTDGGTTDGGTTDGGTDPGALSVAELLPGDLVISEVMKNPAAVDDDYGEWIEVYNATASAVDLNGLAVRDADGAQHFTVDSPLPVEAGGYIVLGVSDDAAANGGTPVDYAYDRSSFVLANDSDTIALEGAVLIDEITYDDGLSWPDTAGAALSLDAGALDAVANDSGSGWCDAVSAFGDGDLGTPGAPNDACPPPEDFDGDGFYSDVDCNDRNPFINPDAEEIPDDGIDQDCDGEDWTTGDTGAADTGAIDTGAIDTGEPEDTGAIDTGISSPLARLSAGALVITEIIQNPDAVSDSSGEWFEVYNAAGMGLNLEGLVISDADSDSFTVTGALFVAAGGYVVFGKNADAASNGGAPVDYDYGGSMSLANGDDELILSYGGTTFDAVYYDDSAGWPDPTGASMSLDPDAVDATLNDDPARWCEATSPFGDGDLGTPGSSNDPCAETDTGVPGVLGAAPSSSR